MAAFMDKMLVSTAITDNTRMDLSCDHVTTSSFFDIAPVYIKEMVPGEKLNMRAQVFSRLKPLTNPTFGRCNINARAFFVPMRALWAQWNEFITDSPYVVGQNYNSQTTPTGYVPSSVPTTSAEQICELVARHTGTAYIGAQADNEWGDSSTNAPTAYDYAFYLPANGASTASTTEYITLNEKGRKVVKVLESLGYKVFPYKNSGMGSTSSADESFSLLPILAYAKVYCDWYVNSAYSVSQATVALIQSYLNSVSQPGRVSVGALYDILTFVTDANYDSDYFVSAWDNPVAPVANAFSTMSLTDITLKDGGPNTDGTFPFLGTGKARDFAVSNGIAANGTPVSTMDYLSSGSWVGAKVGMSVSKFQHDSLNALTDYVKRHQLVGAHVFDRFLARFGKALSNSELRRSVYCGSKVTPVQFGDVMSVAGRNATGQGVGTSQLGDYAGKGIAYGDGQFNYTSNEYGYFMVVGTIIPAVGYVQGIDRMITHVSKLDFWTPEFDNLGVQGIMKSELFVGKDGANTTGQYSSIGATGNPFGYIPRYAEYKVAKDKLTGEFSYDSRNAGLDSWYGFRMFDASTAFGNDADNIVHGYDFTTGDFDGDQYNRIFRDYSSDKPADMFWLIWHFDIRDNAPMKSLFDSYEFESEDDSRKVTETAGGVKFN